MATPAQIQDQYARAAVMYPGLQQIHLRSYSIIFAEAPDQPFSITLPETYANDPPHITCNNNPISIPLIECWVKVFILEQVVAQLQTIVQAPRTQRITVTQKEVECAISQRNPASLEDPSVRREIAKSLPTVVSARDLADRTRAQGQASAEALPALEQSFRDSCAQLQALLNAQRQVRRTIAGLGDQQTRGRRALEATRAQLREMERSAAARVAELQGNWNSGKITLEVYVREVTEARKGESYAKIMAERLSQWG
jgi:hypothetical protein